MPGKTLDQLSTETAVALTDLFPVYPVGGPLKGVSFANLIGSLSSTVGLLQFGPGTDGNVTISAPTTLSHDMFYNNLTMAVGGSLDPAGYRIFVAGTLDISAATVGQINGGGSPGTAASSVNGQGGGGPSEVGTLGASDNLQRGATAAGAGQLNAPANAFTPAGSNSFVNGGGGGGAAGGGGGAFGGLGGSAGPEVTNFVWPSVLPLMVYQSGPAALIGIPGGTGGCVGGGGGGDLTNRGGAPGGGGGGGEVMFIAARVVKRGGAAAASIKVRGANAGAGFAPTVGNAGGAGGSGGGGGGWLVMLIGSFFAGDTPVANLIDVTGGNGSAGTAAHGTGTPGDGGGSGAGGTVTIINLQGSTVTNTFGQAAVAGGAHAGAVGGTGGVAAASQVTL